MISPLSRHLVPSALCLVLATAGCTAGGEEEAGQRAPRVVQPGAPGGPGKVLSTEEVPHPEVRPHTEADVRFMRRMIPHHAQALRMAALVEGRTARGDLPLLARRIAASQEDEIALMRRWLLDRDERVPGREETEGHGHGTGEPMPGMLSAEQFVRLENAKGAEFDRLFLESMIGHHDGALRMVEELFAAGGGEEPEIYRYATHVDADQRIEIDRMRALLAAMGSTPTG
jgi:uncharacterized protein (DUF305 family)